MKRARRPSSPCTQAELDRAIALRAQDLPWSVIADRLGKDQNALEVTVCRYRQGQWGNRYERGLARARAIERFIETTGTIEVPEIARFLRMSVGATYDLMRRLGLDREMREELAALGADRQEAA